MSKRKKIVPWEVGAKDAVCVVGVQGEITAIDRDASSITIAGHTLPTTLGNGVRLLSMTFSGADDGDCDLDHLDDHECEDVETKAVLTELLDEIEAAHLDEHKGAFRYCLSPFCLAAQGRAS